MIVVFARNVATNAPDALLTPVIALMIVLMVVLHLQDVIAQKVIMMMELTQNVRIVIVSAILVIKMDVWYAKEIEPMLQPVTVQMDGINLAL